MIKLAIISDDPGWGGAYKVAADIAQGLDPEEYEVRWFFLCNQPEEGSEGTYFGAPPINFDYSLMSYLRLAFIPKKNELNYEPLTLALLDYYPDILHFHTHATLLSLVGGLKSPLGKAKFIFTDHSQRIRTGEQPLVKQLLMSRVYRRLFSSLQVVFVSEYAYQTAIKLGYGSKNKDTFITNSVDTNKFKPAEEAEKTDHIRVVYLSRIHHAKGHSVLLDAWKLLPPIKNLSLNLYGYEADGGAVNKRIAMETFSNPVYYKGVTTSPERVLQNAHIGVFPSYREGLPLALLEMMATGLPIVASDIPEIKSILTNGKSGLLFECGSFRDLSVKLKNMISNEPMRRKLGKQAFYSAKNYANSIFQKYDRLYKSSALNG